MPRTLILLRHAKAETSRGDDFVRGLTDKGEADASRAAAFLAENRIAPSLALVSDARRTSRTAELVKARLPDLEFRREHDLYNAEAPRIARLVARVDPSVETLMVVAHNPGIMDFAIDLSQDGDRSEIERLRGRFPPCGMAVIAFGGEDWRDACASGGRLDALVFPEDLARDA